MSDFSYKSYTAEVTYSKEDRLLVGRVLNVEALILFSADNPTDLETEFHCAIDAYLKDCEEAGHPAEKPFKGSFNVRIGCESHRRASGIARSLGVSLNDVVRVAVDQFIAQHDDRESVTIGH